MLVSNSTSSGLEPSMDDNDWTHIQYLDGDTDHTKILFSSGYQMAYQVALFSHDSDAVLIEHIKVFAVGMCSYKCQQAFAINQQQIIVVAELGSQCTGLIIFYKTTTHWSQRILVFVFCSYGPADRDPYFWRMWVLAVCSPIYYIW